MHNSRTIKRAEHNISRKSINPNALRVLYGLKDAGFEAYLVGGGVRDILVEARPKDFDLVTNAKPEEIRKLFRNCILIGKRFRLAHVRFGRDIIEVSTFRAKTVTIDSGKHEYSEHGMLLRDNVYGTLEEDVWRRDFTVNALYYRISDFSITDHTGGMKDLRAKKIKMIGDPVVRYREDPVRMLRAVRIAAKLDFTITKTTAAPIKELSILLTNISHARLFEEVNKWFRSGKSLATFKLLQKYELLNFLFPQAQEVLEDKHNKTVKKLLEQGFTNTDQRISEDKTVTPAFLYAVLLWWPLQEQIKILSKDKKTIQSLIIQKAIKHVLQKQKQQTLIPQKLLETIKEIWLMQYQLTKKFKKSDYLIEHPRFRAAYDFLLLRAQSGEQVKEFADFWTKQQMVTANSILSRRDEACGIQENLDLVNTPPAKSKNLRTSRGNSIRSG